MGLLENIVIALLSAFILVLTVLSHFEIKKDCKGLIKATIRSHDPKSLGRALYRWQLIILSVYGFFYGFTVLTGILCLFALVNERLIVYRACRPNDPLGRFLTQLNW